MSDWEGSGHLSTIADPLAGEGALASGRQYFGRTSVVLLVRKGGIT